MIICCQKKTTAQKPCAGCANEMRGFPTSQFQTRALDSVRPKNQVIHYSGRTAQYLTQQGTGSDDMIKATEKNEDTSVSAGSLDMQTPKVHLQPLAILSHKIWRFTLWCQPGVSQKM